MIIVFPRLFEFGLQWRSGPAICVFLVFTPIALSEQFIEFKRGNGTEDVVTTTGPVTWNAGWPSMLRVVLVTNKSVSIHLNCETEPLQGDDRLYNIEFVFRSSKEPGRRWAWTLDGKGRRHVLTVRNVAVNLTFDPLHGGDATLTRMPTTDFLGDLHFHCTAANRFGKRTSNIVEFFDYRKHFPKGHRLVQDTNTISTDVSKQFHCLTRAIQKDPTVVIPYEWRVCNSGDTVPESSKCPSIRKIEKDFAKGWRMQIFSNGTLCWPHVPKAVSLHLKGKDLVCYVANVPMVVYKSLKFYKPDGRFLALRSSEPEPRLIKPAVQTNEKFEVFDSDATEVYLPLEIKHDQPNLTVTWKNVPIVEDTEVRGQCYLEPNEKVPICRGPFSSDSIRNQTLYYSVEVSKSSGKRIKRAADPLKQKGTYAVDFSKGFPKMSVSMPKLVLVADQEDVELECRFKSPSLVIPELNLVGRWLNYNSKTSVASSISEINDNHKNVLAKLDASINIARPRPGQRLIYRVRRMVYRDEAGRSASHYVECIGHRFGHSAYNVRHAVYIRVVPRPNLTLSQTEVDAAWFRTAGQTLRCHVNNRESIEANGAKIQFDWTVGGKKVKDLPEQARRHLKINGKDVHVEPNWPWEANALNSLGNISCHAELLYPSGAKSTSSVFFRSTDNPWRELVVEFPLYQWLVLAAFLIVMLTAVILFVFCRRQSSAQKKEEKTDEEKEGGAEEAFLEKEKTNKIIAPSNCC